jgi:hypothetical protein
VFDTSAHRPKSRVLCAANTVERNLLVEAQGTHEDPERTLRRFVAESAIDRRLAPVRVAEATTYLAVLITATGPARICAVASSIFAAVMTTRARGTLRTNELVPTVLVVAKTATVISVAIGPDWAARLGATWGLVSSLVVLAFAALSVVIQRLLPTSAVGR